MDAGAVAGGELDAQVLDPPEGCRFAPRCPYAQDRCRAEQPPLIEAESPGHVYRCWYPVGTDEGRQALERNLAAHVPQAELAVSGDMSKAAEVEAVVEAAAVEAGSVEAGSVEVDD